MEEMENMKSKEVPIRERDDFRQGFCEGYNVGFSKRVDNMKSFIGKGATPAPTIINNENVEEMENIVERIKSGDNEGTESPYWLIIDPKQSFSCDPYEIANMITGPFFSRADAQTHLTNRRYAFGKYAVVFCHSGYWSWYYKKLCRKIKV